MIKFEEGEVYSFKLRSGEELIGRVKREIPQLAQVEIEKPLIIAMTPQGIEMIPVMLTAQEMTEVELESDDYLFYRKSNDAAVNAYQARTSVIQQPETKKILTG